MDNKDFTLSVNGGTPDSKINPSTGLEGRVKSPVLSNESFSQLINSTPPASQTGDSMFDGGNRESLDPNKFSFQPKVGADNPELRAEDQPVGQEIAYGVGRFVAGTATKFLAGIGQMVGLGAALVNPIIPGTGHLSLGEAVDNGWAQFFGGLDEKQKEGMPIYHTNYYNEGNILQKALTAGFWADDMSDGFAFMAAAWLGGKGLSSLGLGEGMYAKLGEQFAKSTLMARTGKATSELLPKFAEIAKGMDAVTLGAFNSATMSTFMAKDTYNELLNQGLTKDKAAEAAKGTFWWNFASMMPASTIINSMFFGKVNPTVGRIEHIFDKEGNLISEVKPITRNEKIIAGLKGASKSVPAGAWQMGTQSAIGQYFSENALGKDNRGAFEGVINNLIKNVGTVEGQKGMMIGALMGIIPAAVEGIRRAEAEKAGEAALHNMLSYTMSAVDKDLDGRNIWQREQAPVDPATNLPKIDPATNKPVLGKIILDPKTNQPKVDIFKLAEFFNASYYTSNNAFLTMLSHSEGNKMMEDRLDEERASSLAFGLLGSPDGLDHFNALMDDYANQKRKQITDAGGTVDEETLKKQTEDYKSKGKLYQTLYTNVEQAFAGLYNFHTPKDKSEEEITKFNVANLVKDNAMRTQFMASVDQMFWHSKGRELDAEIAKTRNTIGDTEIGKAHIDDLQKQKEAVESTIKMSESITKEVLKPSVWQKDFDERSKSALDELRKGNETEASAEPTTSTETKTPQEVADNNNLTFEQEWKDENGKVTAYEFKDKNTGTNITVPIDKYSEEYVKQKLEQVNNNFGVEQTGTITTPEESVQDEIKAREDEIASKIDQDEVIKARKESIVHELDNPVRTEVTGAETPEERNRLATGEVLAERYGNRQFADMNLKTLFDSVPKDEELNVVYNGEHGTLFIDPETNEVVFKSSDTGKEYIVGKTTDEGFFEGDLKASDLGITPLKHTMFDIKPENDGVGINIQGRRYLMDLDNPLDAIQDVNGKLHITLKDVNSVPITFTSQALTEELAYSLELLHQAREIAFKSYLDEKGLDSDFAVVKDPANADRVFYIYHNTDGSYDILQPHVAEIADKTVYINPNKNNFRRIEPTLKNGKPNKRYQAILKPYLNDLGAIIDRVASEHIQAGVRATEAERNDIKNKIRDEIKQFVTNSRSATPQEVIAAPGTSEVSSVKAAQAGSTGNTENNRSAENGVDKTTAGATNKGTNGTKSSTGRSEDSSNATGGKTAGKQSKIEVTKTPPKSKDEKDIVDEKAEELAKEQDIPIAKTKTAGRADNEGIEPTNSVDDPTAPEISKTDKRRGGAHPATAVATQLDDNPDLNHFLSQKANDLKGHSLKASLDESFTDEDWNAGAKKLFKEDKTIIDRVRYDKNGDDNFDSVVDTIPIKLTMYDKEGKELPYSGMYIHKSKFANEENLVVTEEQQALKDVDPVAYDKAREKMILTERKAIRAMRKVILKKLLAGKEVTITDLQKGVGILSQTRGQNRKITEVTDSPDNGRLGYADSNGTIWDGNGHVIPGRGGAGNIFWGTRETANGDERVVKMNVSKISEEHAKILLKAYQQAAMSKGGFSTTYDGKEVKGGLTVKQVIDYLALNGPITDQNNTEKNPLRNGYLVPKTLFLDGGTLHYGEKTLNLKKKLTDAEVKDFVDHITMNKNYNVQSQKSSATEEGLGGKLSRDFSIGSIDGKAGDTYQSFLFRNGMVQTDLIKDPTTGTIFTKPILMFDYKEAKIAKKPAVKTEVADEEVVKPKKNEVTKTEKRKAAAVAEPIAEPEYPVIKSHKDLATLPAGAELGVQMGKAFGIDENDQKIGDPMGYQEVVGRTAVDEDGKVVFKPSPKTDRSDWKKVAKEFDGTDLSDAKTAKKLFEAYKGYEMIAELPIDSTKEQVLAKDVVEESEEEALRRIYGDSAPFTHLVGKEAYEPGDVHQAIKNLRTKLGPNFKIKTEEDLINVITKTGNRLAFGTFQKDAITLSKKLAKGTEYEEAFHRVSLLYLSPMQQKLVYDDARVKFGMKDATDREVNEKLAGIYREMENKGEKIAPPKTITGKIAQFFTDLFDFLHTVFTGKLRISNLDVDNMFRVMGASNGRTGRLWYAKPRETAYKNMERGDSYTHAVKGRDLDHVKDTAQLTDITKHLVYTMINQSGVFKSKDINQLNYMAPRDVMLASSQYFETKAREAGIKLDTRTADKYSKLAGLHKEIVDNYDIYLDLMKTQLESIGIRTIMPEDPENENDQKGGDNFAKYGKASFELNGKDNAGTAIKLVLATLKDSNSLDADTRLIKLADYDTMYDTLLNDLSEQPSFEDMMKVLKTKDSTPFKDLVNRLEEDHKTDPFDTLSTQFYITMRKNRNKFRNALIDKKGGRAGIQIANAETQTVSNAQAAIWGQAFMLSDAFKEGAVNREFLSGVQTDYLKLANRVKKEFNNKQNEGVMPSYEELFNDTIKLFNKVSVPIDADTLDNMLTKIDPSDKHAALHDLIVKTKMAPTFGARGAFARLSAQGTVTTARGREMTLDSIFRNEQLFTNVVAPSYSEVHGGLTTNTILGPDGNPYYLISDNCFLTDLFHALRTNPNGTGLNFSNLANVSFNEHSNLLKQLADPNVRKKAEITMFSSLSVMKSSDRGRAYQDISDVEDTMIKMGLFEASLIPLPQLADRSHLYIISGLKPIKFNFTYDEKTKKLSIPQPVIDQFYGYAVDEYKQIQRTRSEIDKAIKNGTEDSLKENMHYVLKSDGTRDYEAANGLKYQHFTNFNGKDYKLDTKDVGKAAIYKGYIRKILEDRIDDAIKRFAEQKIVNVTYDKFGKVASITNKLLDETELRKEAKDKFGGTDNAKLDLALRNKIANFQLNSIMSTIESEKMIFMSPAYYKNLDERIKRYTAIASSGPVSRLSMPSDVLPEERLLHDNDNFFTTVLGTQKYDATEVKKALMPKFINIYQKNGYTVEAATARAEKALDKYTSVDPTDGQGYITPDMFRALSIRLGEWTQSKQSAFDLIKLDRELTTKEQNLVDDLFMQPLKFGYFGPELSPKTASPLYYKMSLATLTPRLVEGTQLQHLYDAMTDKDNPIDMVLFDSAVKVGVGPKTDYYGVDKDGRPNTDLVNVGDVANMPRGNASFQFLRKQTITDPHNELRDIVKTQFKKVILSNLDDERTYKVGDESMTGKELKEQNKAMQDELSNRGTQEFLDSIGVDDKTLFNKDPEKLYALLRTRARMSGMADSFIDALADQTDGERFEFDAIPERKWLQAAQLSLLAKKAIDLKLPGTAMIQMANFGLRKIDKDDSLKLRDKDGMMEAKISMEVFRNVIPNYANLSYAERLEFAKEHFQGIGYRVPTQGLVSTVGLKIVDFLPPTSTSTIVLPSEFTTLTGSDFDIDKLYFIRHNYETVKGEPSKVKFLTDKNSTVDKRFDVFSHEAVQEQARSMKKAWATSLQEMFGSRDEIKAQLAELRDDTDSWMTDDDDIDTTSPEYQKRLDDNRLSMAKLKTQKAGLSDLLKEQKKELEAQIEQARLDWKDDHVEEFINRDIIAQNTHEAIENRLIDSYFSVLNSPEHVVDTNMPLDTSTSLLKDIAARVTELEGTERNYPPLHTASFIYQNEVKHKYLWGKKGVGPFARANVHQVLGQIGDIHLGFDIGVGNTREVEGNTVTDLSGIVGQDKENILDWLSALINAHVDIAKDPYIFHLNVNNATYSTGELLIRAGAGGEHAFMFLAQPILKDYAAMQNDSRGKIRPFNGKPLTEVRKQYKIALNKARAAEKLGVAPKSEGEIFDTKRLEKDINVDTPRDANFYARQLQILDKFSKLNEVGKALFQAVEAATVDTKRFGNNLVELRRFNKLVDKVIKDNVIKNMDKVFSDTFIGQYYQNSVILGQSLFKDTTVSASDAITALHDRIMEEIGRGDDITQEGMQYLNKINNEIFSSIVGKFFIKNMGVDRAKVESMFYGDDNMVVRLNHIKNNQKYKDNPFLKLLQPSMSFKEGVPDHIITFTATDTKSKWAKDRTIDGWAELLTSPDKEVAEFAKDMVPYSYFTSGFNKSIYSVYNFIPPKYLKEIGFSEYMKNTREGFNDVANYNSTQDLHDDVFKSLWEDDDVVPFVSYNKLGQKRITSAENGWGEKYPMQITVSNKDRVGNETGAVKELELGYNQYGQKIYKPFIKTEVSGTKQLYKFVGENIAEDGTTEPVYVISQKLGYYEAGKMIKENGLEKSIVPENQSKELPDNDFAVVGYKEDEEGNRVKKYDFSGFQAIKPEDMKIVEPIEDSDDEAPDIKAEELLKDYDQTTGKTMGEETKSTGKVNLVTTNYTKDTPKDKTKGFFFTENLQAYLADRSRLQEQILEVPTTKIKLNVTADNNQAGIRTDEEGKKNDNVFAIISKKFQQNKEGKFVKEEGQFKDTDSDFKIFKKYNTESIKEALDSKLPLNMSAGGIATGKSALPFRFAEWLKGELEDKLGVTGDIKENKTPGYNGYGIFDLRGADKGESLNEETKSDLKSIPDDVKDRLRDKFSICPNIKI